MAATILMHFYEDEEMAFWVFVTLMDRFNWKQLFDGKLAGLTQLLDSFACCLPSDVALHLEAHGLPPSTYAANWMLTLFTAAFDCWSAVLQIWDLMWLLGPEALVPAQAAVAIISHYRDRILSCNNSNCLLVLLHHTIPQTLVHVGTLRDNILTEAVLMQPLPIALCSLDSKPPDCP
uniref:Rab-GAP TBC domain-containing protein n=1 Tax=Eutreptiella gymnastica TaxID=73025 RepID=A0A7S1ITU4_9EUGL